MSRKELQVSWFGYKNDAALAGLSGLKTNEAKLAGALNVQSLGRSYGKYLTYLEWCPGRSYRYLGLDIRMMQRWLD